MPDPGWCLGPDLLWCALAGLVAGAVIAAPVWLWAWRRERQRAEAYERLAHKVWQRMQDDA